MTRVEALAREMFQCAGCTRLTWRDTPDVILEIYREAAKRALRCLAKVDRERKKKR